MTYFDKEFIRYFLICKYTQEVEILFIWRDREDGKNEVRLKHAKLRAMLSIFHDSVQYGNTGFY